MKSCDKFIYLSMLVFLVINFFLLASVSKKLTRLSNDVSALPGNLVVERHVADSPSADQIAKKIIEYENAQQERMRLPANFVGVVTGWGENAGVIGHIGIYLQQKQGIANEVKIEEIQDGISMFDFEGVNMGSDYPRYRVQFGAREGSFPSKWSFTVKFLNYEGRPETRNFNVFVDPDQDVENPIRISSE